MVVMGMMVMMLMTMTMAVRMMVIVIVVMRMLMLMITMSTMKTDSHIHLPVLRCKEQRGTDWPPRLHDSSDHHFPDFQLVVNVNWEIERESTVDVVGVDVVGDVVVDDVVVVVVGEDAVVGDFVEIFLAQIWRPDLEWCQDSDRLWRRRLRFAMESRFEDRT